MAWIIPASIGYNRGVVFGGRNTSFILDTIGEDERCYYPAIALYVTSSSFAGSGSTTT